MDATHDARVRPHGRAGRARGGAAVTRLRDEARAAVELWLLPALVASLPYRAGIALARRLARALPLYEPAARASVAQWRAAGGGGDERAFAAAFRFAQLVDHADLFWALTRSRRFLLRRLRAPSLPSGVRAPLLVVSFHYGQGLWLMHWLATQGVAARFVSIRLVRSEAQGAVHYAYARLRIRAVERLAGIAPIFTGGARREIAATLQAAGAVYGLLDVPIPEAAGHAPNATLRGQPVLLPAGLLESARGTGAGVLVLTARTCPDGSRVVQADPAGAIEQADVGALAALLDRRIAEAPAAWHFWHLWPRFAVPR